MAISVLPMLNVGGMQLFRLESSDTSEKILPRTAQIAGSITRLYFLITGSCLLAYWLAGMSFFDAVAHAMTTIATGGFSTRDASLAAFDTPLIEMVAIFFMLASSLPFVAYLQLRNRNFSAFLRDGQIRFFLAAAASVTALMWFYQIANGTGSGAMEASAAEPPEGPWLRPLNNRGGERAAARACVWPLAELTEL